MCGIPMMAAGLAISALTAADTVYQQDRERSAQNDFNDKQREADLKAMNDNLSQIELAKQQATSQASEKINANNIQARQAMSTAKVSAGENGVAGVSVDALLAELDGSRARYNDSVTANLKDNVDNLNNQRTNIYNNTASQINQLKTPKAPDYLGAALRIGSAANTYYSGQQKPSDPYAAINLADK